VLTPSIQGGRPVSSGSDDFVLPDEDHEVYVCPVVAELPSLTAIARLLHGIDTVVVVIQPLILGKRLAVIVNPPM